MTRLEPIRLGEVLKHDFMDPFGLSATALARAIGVTPARINEIAGTTPWTGTWTPGSPYQRRAA